MLELLFFLQKTTENISEMSYFPLYKNLQFKLLHSFTLIRTDDNCFLGTTLRDATSQSIRHHNKQSFIKRIDDVKAVSVQYTRAIVSLDSILLKGT